MVAHILCLVLLLPALAACAYYLTLAAVGLIARCRPAGGGANSTGSCRSLPHASASRWRLVASAGSAALSAR